MISSPCIGKCRVDDELDLCSGCARSPAEIAAWREATPAFRRQVWEELPERRRRLGLNLHRLDWDLEALRDFLIGSLRPGGTWTSGVPGAVAEFSIGADEPCEISAKPNVIHAYTRRGALSFRLGEHVRAFALDSNSGRKLIVLATPRGKALSPSTTGLARIGPDQDAVRAQDRHEVLYDFGLDRVSFGFGVRTAIPDLIARLDSAVGLDWRQFMPLIGNDLRLMSPTRVVRNSIGRIEVFTAIPAADGVSVDGPHTHFLPDLLADPRDAPAGIEMPEAYVPCAVYYPRRRAEGSLS